ncbi:F-box protein [Sesamum alatum]|uniref:F-box protein n=1 Tax=Sesamum alatum TaxID=300844 RepID=A0AAE1Y0E7_9LAMI|nr:F-box protein [Sesamum alatum]
MELAPDHFRSLNLDLLVEIMSRLDGSALAASASTCTALRDAARDEKLWQKLCNEAWPSTSKGQLQLQIASSETGSFKSLYADALPLVLYEVTRGVRKRIPAGTILDTTSSPWDFISLIDIYYKGSCIFSEVVDGMIEGMYRTCSQNFSRFLCYPFKLDLLDFNCPEGESHDFQDFGSRENNLTKLPLAAFTGCEGREDLCNKIVGDLQLSWILYDKRKGRAVNISSWKPRSIYRSYPPEEGYVICFGCIIPVEDDRLPHTLAECIITVKCKLMIKQGCIKWKEISLVIKDKSGSNLNGEQSMAVMKQALSCPRSIDHYMVELGYQQFCKQKMELQLRDEQEESVANILSAAMAIATLLGICYACATLL